MRARAFSIIVILGASLACTITGPENATSGNWGGAGFAAVVSDTSTVFEFRCAAVVLSHRLATATSGEFAVKDTLFVGYDQWPVTIVGRMTPDEVAIDMTPGWPDVDTPRHYSARRNATPNFDNPLGICM